MVFRVIRQCENGSRKTKENLWAWNAFTCRYQVDWNGNNGLLWRLQNTYKKWWKIVQCQIMMLKKRHLRNRMGAWLTRSETDSTQSSQFRSLGKKKWWLKFEPSWRIQDGEWDKLTVKGTVLRYQTPSGPGGRCSWDLLKVPSEFLVIPKNWLIEFTMGGPGKPSLPDEVMIVETKGWAT